MPIETFVAKSLSIDIFPASAPVKKNMSFWAMILAICVSTFTCALDLTTTSTALPVIVNDLRGVQFVWISPAYALLSMAFLPMSGGFAQMLSSSSHPSNSRNITDFHQAFGRRPAMICSLLMFALGSALCGASPTMNFLIAARAVQGTGAGGITGLSQIILSDLIPLKDRGLYKGLVGFSWALARVWRSKGRCD